MYARGPNSAFAFECNRVWNKRIIIDSEMKLGNARFDFDETFRQAIDTLLQQQQQQPSISIAERLHAVAMAIHPSNV